MPRRRPEQKPERVGSHRAHDRRRQEPPCSVSEGRSARCRRGAELGRAWADRREAIDCRGGQPPIRALLFVSFSLRTSAVAVTAPAAMA